MQQKRFLTLSLGLVGILALISLYSCKKNEVPSPVPNTVTYDGFTYHTVTIPGAGTWTVENARNTHFRNGDLIRNAKTNAEWLDSTNKKINNKASDTGAWCYYNNTIHTDTQNIYGKLYNWYAVKDARGLAPTGWRVPTDADFKKLKTVLGDSAGQKLKSKLYWTRDKDSTKPNRNSSGFTAVPAGYRTYDAAHFVDIKDYSVFWSSTEDKSNNVWDQVLSYNDAGTYRNFNSKLYGFSVRYVRD